MDLELNFISKKYNVFSNRRETKDVKFKYKLEGDFDNIKYVYLRSIEGGFGGLEDKLVYTR